MCEAPGSTDLRIYAGIDEAGYGPTVGPLCVALTVFRIDANDSEGAQDHSPPDLWRTLRPAVSRCGAGASGRRGRAKSVLIDDSKLLLGSGASRSLRHLERGVLAMLGLAGREAGGCDRGLLESLGVTLDESASWYAGAPTPTPVHVTADEVAIARNLLEARMRRTGVGVLDIRCTAMEESRFNARYAELASKAAVSFELVAGHLRRVMDEWGAHEPYVAIDRQGGRSRYARVLARAFPDCAVDTLIEGCDASVYRVTRDEGAASRSMRIEFRVGGDSAHLPTALASMTAKLVRELAMLRFNRYWTQRCPGLKPTAGYALDARRWLGDVAGALAPGEREALVRLA